LLFGLLYWSGCLCVAFANINLMFGILRNGLIAGLYASQNCYIAFVNTKQIHLQHQSIRLF